MPLQATQHTPEGARAFAEFFIKTIDWGYATQSGKYIDDFSSRGCDGCRAFIDGFNKAYRAGHRYVGGRITVKRSSLVAMPFVKAEHTAFVTFNILSFEELTRAGAFVNADGAHTGARFEVSLNWTANRWTVVELAVDE